MGIVHGLGFRVSREVPIRGRVRICKDYVELAPATIPPFHGREDFSFSQGFNRCLTSLTHTLGLASIRLRPPSCVMSVKLKVTLTVKLVMASGIVRCNILLPPGGAGSHALRKFSKMVMVDVIGGNAVKGLGS